VDGVIDIFHDGQMHTHSVCLPSPSTSRVHLRAMGYHLP